MKQIPLKQKILILTSSIFVCILLVILFIIVPSLHYIQNIKHDIQKTEAQIEDQYNKAKLLRKSLNKLDTIKKEISLLKNIKASTASELILIQNFERLSTIHNVAQQLSLERTDDKYIFNFVLRGTYKNLMSYLSNLEHFQHYIIIPSLEWTKTKDDIVLKFTGYIYSY